MTQSWATDGFMPEMKRPLCRPCKRLFTLRRQPRCSTVRPVRLRFLNSSLSQFVSSVKRPWRHPSGEVITHPPHLVSNGRFPPALLTKSRRLPLCTGYWRLLKYLKGQNILSFWISIQCPERQRKLNLAVFGVRNSVKSVFENPRWWLGEKCQCWQLIESLSLESAPLKTTKNQLYLQVLGVSGFLVPQQLIHSALTGRLKFWIQP